MSARGLYLYLAPALDSANRSGQEETLVRERPVLLRRRCLSHLFRFGSGERAYLSIWPVARRRQCKRNRADSREREREPVRKAVLLPGGWLRLCAASVPSQCEDSGEGNS